MYRQCHLFASIMLTDGFHGDVGLFVAAQFVACKSCSMRELNWVDPRSCVWWPWADVLPCGIWTTQNTKRSSLDSTLVLASTSNGICRQPSPLIQPLCIALAQALRPSIEYGLLNPSVSCRRREVMHMSRAMCLMHLAYGANTHLTKSIQDILIRRPLWRCTSHPCADHMQASCHTSRIDRWQWQTILRLTIPTVLHNAAWRNDCDVWISKETVQEGDVHRGQCEADGVKLERPIERLSCIRTTQEI